MLKIPTQFKETVNALLPFEDSELLDIISLFRKRTFKKGERILDFGEVCKDLIFIEKGILKEFYLEEDREHITWILPEGYFTLSLGSYIDEKPSLYAIECLESTEVYLLTKNQHQTLIQSNFKVLLFNNYLQMAYLRRYEQRMELLRTHNAKNKYLLFKSFEKEIHERVAMNQIANYLKIAFLGLG